MPDIIPFRAIHYPWDSDFSRLTAPPYDVIGPDERQALIASHDHNVIGVTLGGDHSGADDGKYAAAGSRLRDWVASGIVVQDDEPMFFLYGMAFSADGRHRTTLGLLASLALEDYGAGQIFPHERTIPGPILDRLRLMRATEANLEPLWFFASSRVEGFRGVMEATMTQTPLASVTDRTGVVHSLWGVGPADASEIVESIRKTPLVIADGHHRYETALAYRDERRGSDGPGPWERTLALIVDPVDYPPLLKPIHRLTHGVSVGQIAELVAEAPEADEASDGGSPLAAESSAGIASEPSGGSSAKSSARSPSLPSVETDPGPEAGSVPLRPEAGSVPLSPEAGSVPLSKVSGSLKEVVRLVEDEGPGTIGVVTNRGAWIIRTQAELDTIFLNDHILEPSGAEVKYEHDPEQVEAMLGDGVVAFILAAAPIHLVAAKALAGERMPPKTTLFWPKPRTGFVMRDLRPE